MEIWGAVLMKMKPYYYVSVIIFCFILGNFLATIPVIALNSGNLSTDGFDGTVSVENKIDSRMSDEATAVQGELVEYDGRSTGIGTDIVPPEDPPEITGRNYTMTTTTYSWDDASDGDTHYVTDDNAAYIMIPFEFEYYGQTYWDLIITANGKISFTDMSSAPTGSYPSGASEDWYSMAPYWADLEPASNIYSKHFTSPSRFVIQYDSIDYEVGGLAGTFQLVLFEWGDIEFRYDYLQNMVDYTVGLNYGSNTSFYNTYNFGVDPVDDLALRFEYVSRFVFITSEHYSSSSDYTLTWTARSDVTIDNYHIFVDYIYDGSTSSMSYPLSGLSENWHYFEVWMETGGENVTYQMDFYFDYTPPTVTIEYPLNGTTLVDGKVNWSAFDMGSLTHIEILIDHVLYQTLEWYESETYVIAENGQWHNITVVAYDEAMNFASDNVTIFYDRTAAAVGILTSHGENDLWGIRDLYLSLGHIVLTMYESLDTYPLDAFDVIFIASRSDMDVIWTGSEITAMETYLSNGGILVTVGDSWLSSSLKTILETYGIEFIYETSWPHDYTTNFDASHPLMTGVSSLYLPSLDNKFDISFPAFELFGTEDGTAEFGVVAELAETKILSLCYGFDFYIDEADNQLLWENILDYWLTVDTHDLRAGVGEPDEVSVATTVFIDIHVINNGLSTETSFTAQMWVEGTLVGSMGIPSLDSGKYTTLSFLLVIAYTGSINITAYVAPVTGETNTANNRHTKFVDVYQFTIISPIDMESVQGGLVWVNYTCNDIANLVNITGILNGVEIFHSYTMYMSGISEIIVPVFENGTNIITLVGTWSNGIQSNDSVFVDSYNVCPLMDPSPGDYYDLQFEMVGYGVMQYFNFTFDAWVSTFEINCTMIIGMFNGTGWEWMQTWLVTNVLNGYVSDISPGTPLQLNFYRKRLMVVPSFLSPELMPYSTTIDVPAYSRAAMGTKTCWMDWTQIFTVTGVDSWNGYETLVMTGYMGADITLSVLSCTGMFVHFIQDMGVSGTAIGDVIRTNLLPPSDRAPIVNHPDDIDIQEGTGEFNINWVASGNYPTVYETYVNGVLENSDSWYAGQYIWLNGTNLDPGLHNCSIVFYDNNGQFTMDTVWVDVEDTIDPTIDNPGNQQFEEDTAGRSIIWNPYDNAGVSYEVLQNGSGTTLSWDGGQVVFSLDGLAAGVYNFTLVVYDYGSNIAYDTVIVFVDPATAPAIASPADVEYEVGATSNSIFWTVSDDYSDSWVLYIDGVIDDSDDWDGSNLLFLVDGLAEGSYNYTLVVFDIAGHSSSDTVMVIVSAGTTTTTTTTATTTTTNDTDTTTGTGIPPDVMNLIIMGSIGGLVIIIIIIIIMRKK